MQNGWRLATAILLLVVILFQVQPIQQSSWVPKAPPHGASLPGPPGPPGPPGASGAGAGEKPEDASRWKNVFQFFQNNGDFASQRTMRMEVGGNIPGLREALRDLRREVRRVSARVEEVAERVLKPQPPIVRNRYPSVRLNISAQRWLDDKKKAQAMRNNVSPALTEAEEQALPNCTAFSDLLDGGVVRDFQGSPKLAYENLRYYPKAGKCKLAPLSEGEIQSCWLRRKVVLIGDSTFGEIAARMKDILGLKEHFFHDAAPGNYGHDTYGQWKEFSLANGTVLFNYFWVNSAEFPLPSPGLDLRGLHESLREADFVFVTHGLHDHGMGCHLLSGYLHGVGSRLAEVRKSMKPTGQLFWVATKPVHNLVRLAKEGQVFALLYSYLMNMPDRVDAFRETAAVAAACAKVPTVPTSAAFGVLPELSGDGLHYSPSGVNLMVRMLTSITCNLQPPKPLPPCGNAVQLHEQKIASLPPELRLCIDSTSLQPIERFLKMSEAELEKEAAAEEAAKR